MRLAAAILAVAVVAAACASAPAPEDEESVPVTAVEPVEPAPVDVEPPAEVPPVLILEDVLRLVPGAPVNRAARAAVVRAEENLSQADLSPNPMLMLGADRFPLDDLGEGPLRYGIRAYQTIETGGKRSKRAAVGEAGVATAEWEERIVNLTIARAAAGAHQEALAADRRVTIRAEAVKAGEELTALVEGLVLAGRERESALPPIRARVGRLRLALEDERARRRRALADLEAVLSLPAGSVEGVKGELLLPAELPEGAGEGNPSIGKERAAVDVEAARAESADTGRYPDVRVGLGYEYLDLLEGGVLNSVGVYLEIPLPFFDRNQGDVRAAVAAARRAEDLTEAERARVASEYAMTLSLIGSASANLATWRGSVLPAMARDRELSEAAFDAGRATRNDVLVAKLAELDASVMAIGEEAKLAALTLDALALLGRPPADWIR
ncbi:MAG: TolC family protein [Planctomycetota bacterium]